MGHYARGSRRVVAVEECPVHAAAGNERAFAFRDACASAGVQAAGPPRARGAGGVLKSLAVRVARRTAERMMTVVVTARRRPRPARGHAPRDRAGRPRHALHVNLHPRATRSCSAATRGASAAANGCATTSRGVCVPDLADRVLPDQRRRRGAAGRARARGVLPERVPVLDLYAGAGLFALPLAQAGHDVVAVEENAGRGGRRRGQPGAQPHSAGAMPLGRRHGRSRPWRGSPACDTVVLDPPREGCSPAVRAQLFARRRPVRLVYVSCNPDTLARDLGDAAAHGYAVESLQPVDMFPHTPHVETVAVLRRPGRSA